MVMEKPSPLLVGREFVRQYYTLLNKAPDFLHRFYGRNSSYVHGGLDADGKLSEAVYGQTEIHQKVLALQFSECHTKIRHVDAHASLSDAVVVQVMGELSNSGQPMRRFLQTFVLAPEGSVANKFYVHNDIFRYEDEVFGDSEAELDEESEEETDEPEDRQPSPEPLLDGYEAHAVSCNNGVEEAHEEAALELEPEPKIEEPKLKAEEKMVEEFEEKAPSPDPVESPPNIQEPPKTSSWASVTSKNLPLAGTVPSSGAQPHVIKAPNSQPRVEAKAELPSASIRPRDQRIRDRPSVTSRGPRSDGVSSSDSQTGKPLFSFVNKGRADDSGEVDSRRVLRHPDSHQLFVGNLPHDIHESELKDFFMTFGNVVELRINTKGTGGKIPNFGFVVFDDSEPVQRILGVKVRKAHFILVVGAFTRCVYRQIQKLCDRVASSTLLEDRRDAVRAIKSLSKKYRVEVGTMAMDHLLRILQSDRTDTEILGYALDTLYNIVCSDEEEEPEDSEEENQQKQEDDLGARFTEEFIGEPDNITLLLTLLEEFDFHVRWRGVKLLTVLLKSQCAPVQSIVLVSPMGESRNIHFSCSWIEAAPCRVRMSSCALSLQLVRVMVSPVNSPGATASCQRAMFQCGLLQQLCTILMATGVPADILTETINTVSEVIRGAEVNQDYFASVNAPSNPPRPAIVVLLMSMVNERQPFVLRCAVLYCFQCFLYKNHKGQGEIVATLLPSTIDASSISAGQLLCGGLFSADSLSNWCAAVALAHALQDNLTQKEQLLRVQLATSLGKPPVSLLQQSTNILSQGSRVQTKVGLLMLLCTWISNCPIAVMHFLHNQDNVPFLTGQISENLGEDERLVQGLCALLLGICIYYNDNSLENYTKEKLKQLIEKRIGKENFVEKLGFISKHELYSRAAQKPQPAFSAPEHMLFDHEFTKLIKELEGMITKAVLKSSEEEKKEEEVKKTLEQHDSIVTQYKELIREQDCQINELKEQVASLTSQSETLQSTVTQQFSQMQQHKDQYNILKLKLGKDGHVNSLQTEEQSRLREKLEELQRQNQGFWYIWKCVFGVQQKAEATPSAEGSTSDATALQKEVELLRAQLQSQSAEIAQLQREKHQLLRGADATAAAAGDDAIRSELESRLSAQTLKEQVQALLESKELMERELSSATSSTAVMQTEKSKLQQELQESKKEQDDLLMLLADQDQKILSLKHRLEDLGETIEDEDDLDARDQFDDDDDDEEEECDE
ncbi:general vesicular transport factor p115-like [Sinocyclocheilus grahami]|uniref:general vesicular transport factor p115-like n=1 Tax=Sinocyclocheilus grahami TaxID=75366 RepID=UPI0007AD5A48|nr:PREDICTED: general vesicular transport factor p115-like [Sinocyclocheilus grahami]